MRCSRQEEQRTHKDKAAIQPTTHEFHHYLHPGQKCEKRGNHGRYLRHLKDLRLTHNLPVVESLTGFPKGGGGGQQIFRIAKQTNGSFGQVLKRAFQSFPYYTVECLVRKEMATKSSEKGSTNRYGRQEKDVEPVIIMMTKGERMNERMNESIVVGENTAKALLYSTLVSDLPRTDCKDGSTTHVCISMEVMFYTVRCDLTICCFGGMRTSPLCHS